jgi:hypothetical protein
MFDGLLKMLRLWSGELGPINGREIAAKNYYPAI